MEKLDTSCGLTNNQIGSIKFVAKNAISRLLPILPEPVEMKLFFQGRDAWIYSWALRAQHCRGKYVSVSLEIVVKLKKEFQHSNVRTRYKFLCKVKLGRDIYQSKVVSLEEVIA